MSGAAMRRALLVLAASLVCGALPGRSASAGATEAPVISRIETRDPVVFVTIDDGNTRSPRVAADLRKLNWPVTSFVVPSALARDPDYFIQLGATNVFGNHTTHHPNLKKLSERAQRAEICGGADKVAKLVGKRPTWLRPPYGAHNAATRRAAAACGMDHIVTWRVTVYGNRISTWGGPIKRGDIILLHYIPSLHTSLRALARELERLGLRPADLAQYLNR